MKIAKSLAITATIACCLITQPAYSSDFVQNLLQQFTGTVTNWDDLESRHHVLEEQIRQALEAGNISLTDADQLRLQLNPVSDAVIQGRASGSPLSFTQGLSYSQTINSVTAALQQAIAAKQSTPPDIDALQTELSQRIDEAQNANQLTVDDATRLKGQLRTIADIESTIKTSGDGNLTAKQIDTLSTRLSDIKTQLVQAIKMGQSAIPELTNRAGQLQARINGALGAGQINSDQAKLLSAELNSSVALRINYVNNNQYLNGKQILELAGDLDHVSNDLQTAIGLAHNIPENATSVNGLSVMPGEGGQPPEQQIRPLTIDNVEVTPSGKVSAGDVITVRAFGSANAMANFSIQNGVHDVPMDERRDGVYVGSYTVRKTDNIGRARVYVSLSKSGAQPVSGQSRAELMLDAMPPEILVEPGPNTVVAGGHPSIVVKFTDGHGSGVDPASVHLLINGQDVVSQAIMDGGMVAYRPGLPLFGMVSAEIKLADNCGNAVDYSWSFTALPRDGH